MGKKQDLVGNRYCTLTVVEVAYKQSNKTFVTVLCDCGNTQVVRSDTLKAGKSHCNRCYCKKNSKDMLGYRVGMLTVIEQLKGDRQGSKWLCQCDCGNTKVLTGCGIRRASHNTSCGCNKKVAQSIASSIHGLSNTRVDDIHRHMKYRCNTPTAHGYAQYGGRGITYDPKWESLEGFLEDMSAGYSDGLTLDRIDPNGNYSKENCRWATPAQQQRNRRKTKANKTGVTGVRETSSAFIATVYSSIPVPFKKHFSKKKYGYETAFALAIESRENCIAYLNEQGFGYTEFHGK